MTENEYKEQLKGEGFNTVYVWNAAPYEQDPDHSHEFDTKLVILDGEIEIGMGGKRIVLKKDDSIEIPRQTIHSGKVGVDACKYIVAERH